jgi:hypothetical protein
LLAFVVDDDDNQTASAMGENPMNRLLLPERLVGSGTNATTSGSVTDSTAIATVIRCLSHIWVTASVGQISSPSTQSITCV